LGYTFAVFVLFTLSSFAETNSALGRKIFFDTSLSNPVGTSCASCHDPAQAYSGNNGSLNGVAKGSFTSTFAERNTPSVLYLKFVPPFFFRWEEDAPLPDPHGGLFWDGRADTVALAVQQPLLNPNEMGNPDAANVMKKIEASSYSADFYQEFNSAKGNPTATMTAIGVSLQAFLNSDEMAPFTSKYDDYIRGKATLSSLETQGLELFKNPSKGNCVTCHILNDASSDPTRSLFTDYGFEAAGIPRNPKIPATKNANYYDLGLCDRRDSPLVSNDARLCGQFRTPTLRNVAVRKNYMHNGVFTNLRDVVNFYATRDTNSAHWYTTGVVYDDVPLQYRAQVNIITVPYNRRTNNAPALTDNEIDAIVAFLQTLTDAEYRN
jgi:cytochrome c peroxidase